MLFVRTVAGLEKKIDYGFSYRLANDIFVRHAAHRLIEGAVCRSKLQNRAHPTSRSERDEPSDRSSY